VRFRALRFNGTAIISSAALLNALELAGKEVEHTKNSGLEQDRQH
jgi:hypothetical protein